MRLIRLIISLSIFSPIDNQTCADHDRAEGEGVGMTDYTLIKLQLLEPYPPTIYSLLSKLPAASSTSPPHVYLPAATLRPETMYGQTNVFLLPEGEYGVFDVDDATIFICTAKSALNMSYQNIMRERGQVRQLGTIKGQELMGLPVKAPLCSYERVYVLPLTTIKMDKVGAASHHQCASPFLCPTPALTPVSCAVCRSCCCGRVLVW